ncbi:hypothetical protein HAX54_016819, partial [Datura stramonium]|nr:hypothetical protein [Datura stramonium]
LLSEQLFEAWERFQYYILWTPNHGFLEHILLENFYTILDALTQSVANNIIGGCFMDKTFNRISIILDKIEAPKQRNKCGNSLSISSNEGESGVRSDNGHYSN